MGRPDAVTVVIATRNRRERLGQTLGHLVDLPEQPSIVVVDNASSDATGPYVRAMFPQVTVVAAPANLGAAARTIGARLALTPYVAFSDDDSWWDPGALAVAVDLLAADPEIALLAARVLVGPTATVDPTSASMSAGTLDEWLRPGPGGLRGVTGFLACAAVVRRTAFLAVGGFETQFFIGGEEELVSLDLAQAGWKLVYAPEVVARHHPSAQRDAPLRRRLLLRNHLMTTWLRYTVPAAGRRSLRALRPEAHRVATWSAAGAVARRGPWVLAHRRVVDGRVEGAFDPATERTFTP